MKYAKVLKNMKPNSYARTWLWELPADSEYTLKFTKEKDLVWCYVYLDRKKVWDCNDKFAEEHFYKGEQT